MTDPYIHPSLKRKTPMSSKPIRRTSKPRKRAGEDLAGWDREQYRDATGLAFSDLRGHMEAKYGKRVSDWPDVNRQKNPIVLRRMHEMFQFCFICDQPAGGGVKVEMHHLFSSRGKSDEYWALVPVCMRWGGEGCHAKEVSEETLAVALYRKWLHDREHVLWERMSLLARRYLPDLIVQ